MINTSRYRIICVGKIRKKWIQEGLNTYLKRLPDLSIIEVRDTNPRKETELINSLINKGELIIILNENGQNYSSLAFTNKLKKLESKRLVFIIGGASGLDRSNQPKPYCNLSLSLMTFTHEIARLLLVEQIYRSKMISSGSPYHRQ
tara:strand:- start:73 stop:510 length:438 start_codon:yes stop_codon:yes gene_type:complete